MKFQPPELIAIVAHDTKRGIGKNGQIPWHIPEDFEHFKQVTSGHIVIMGRKTWDSLPKKPLSNRINIVISKTLITDKNCIYASCPQKALGLARVIAKHNGKKVFVIGGSSIYDAYKYDYTQIIATEITGDYQADTFFPLLPGNWVKDNRRSRVTDDGVNVIQYNWYDNVS